MASVDTVSKLLIGLAGWLEWQITYEPTQRLLFVETTGPVEAKSLPAFFKAVAEAMKQHRCKLLFVDHRKSKLCLSPVDIYYIPRLLSDCGISGQKAAVLFKNLGEDEQFTETVCRNRGIKVQAFTDVESASAWLRRPEDMREVA